MILQLLFVLMAIIIGARLGGIGLEYLGRRAGDTHLRLWLCNPLSHLST